MSRLRASEGADQGAFVLGGQPFGLAFDGESIWVTNSADNTVVRLRTSDGAILGAYPAGSAPEGIAFDGLSVWAASSQSNTLIRF